MIKKKLTNEGIANGLQSDESAWFSDPLTAQSLMKPFSIEPIQPTNDHRNHELLRKPTDIKIYDLILSQIHFLDLKEGSLLASATAPYVVIPAIRRMPKRKHPFLIPRRTMSIPSRYWPIGLNRCESHPWINALMQFLLFIPTLREIFAYTPQSFYCFTAFIDQYFADVEEKRIVSQAESSELIGCLINKFPHLFHETGNVNLHRVIQAISQSACAFTSLKDAGFRSEWQILWNPDQDLCMDEILLRKVVPPELLIAREFLRDSTTKEQPQLGFGRSLQRQYFSTQTSAAYELDAWIEHRIEQGEKGDYLTYLKIDGAWIQCADEHIAKLWRSTSLDLPQQRGVLFHYRRVLLGPNHYFV